MKKIVNISVLLLVLSSALQSCNDDFVNTKPLNEIPDETTWSDAALSEAFVTEIYNGFGVGGFYEQEMASMTDEALFTHPNRGINTVTESRSNPADQGYIMDTYEYGRMYSRIRAANIAIKNLVEPKFDKGKANKLLGEAYFFRAYYHQQLLRFYGGVPFVKNVSRLTDNDFMVSRNTYEECVNAIVSDLDSASLLLKTATFIKGRVSETAALALKSRVLLYAASDLHDASKAKAKSTLLAGYTNPEYLMYTSGNQAERWTKAKNAAKEVLNHSEFAYKLDLSAAESSDNGTANYMALSLGGGSKSADASAIKDLILGRFFIDEKDERGGWVGRDNGPNGYHNWAGNTPIQLLIDDYETQSGQRFDWSNATMAANPYQNRDPRLKATVLYDGADWKPRTADVKTRDPYNQIQTGQYEIINGQGQKTIQFGLDTRKSPIEDWNGSRTGYYIRKFTDPDPAMEDQNTRQRIPWPLFRYTEAVLNYVEACIELGEDVEAKTWLNKIRFRAGMPAITETGSALKSRYRNERRIELAYEEHRFFDARRWMIAAETLGRKANIINITGTLKDGKKITIYKYDPSNYTYKYVVSNIDPGIENRSWDDKMYFTSIHRDEINRNTKLIQNPGY
ncbi:MULTISPECIES: RagB/SusD family nutrient uptake outer membrane protein [Sphingobacterium]|uniref:Putative outer membrane starch-binding protein n=1 Tax=Sphingobacterium siyangense TaxID=459529 RepID=A0A562N010_9SPHI|nr:MULTISPECIES: RagB/SusD family nutrient uptake outer membrane protein [Sphingobacterium]QQT33315.1 RagB/SusD family nutrient uptake outer membrane protein [Sphingobacterium multivorum]TWI25446.1 putative outer membrane starch-binding protein [Sphingobacterium siyangense]